MKKLLPIVIILFSCSKQAAKPAENKDVTARASVQDGRNSQGYLCWKPGLIFSRGINATGTARIEWYLGGNPGYPWKTWTKTINFIVTTNSNGYFELSDDRLPDPRYTADSARIKEFALTSGDYNVTIIN